MTLEGEMSLSSDRGYPTHSPKRGWNDKELRASDVVEKYRSFSWHRNSMTEFKVGLRKLFVSTFTKNRSGGTHLDGLDCAVEPAPYRGDWEGKNDYHRCRRPVDPH